METSTFIAIYFPLLVLFLVILPQNQRQRLLLKSLKKRGHCPMSNQLIQECIGKICCISTGSFGGSYTNVKILEVADNWVKVEKAGQVDLINADFIQSIRPVVPKKGK